MLTPSVDFNSIKVRLKRNEQTTRLCLHSHFNSIKVRLKHSSDRNIHIGIEHFNSIKVRLKRNILSIVCHSDIFQFHKGTIKTSVQGTEPSLFLRFQFHKGTIKTSKSEISTNINSISIP